MHRIDDFILHYCGLGLDRSGLALELLNDFCMHRKLTFIVKHLAVVHKLSYGDEKLLVVNIIAMLLHEIEPDVLSKTAFVSGVLNDGSCDVPQVGLHLLRLKIKTG